MPLITDLKDKRINVLTAESMTSKYQEMICASRMPDHLPSVDPDFLRAVETVPEEAIKEKET